KHKEFDDIARYILALGGTYDTCINVYQEFGPFSIMTINHNPYKLNHITTVKFKTIDLIAKNLNLKSDDPRRIQCAIEYFLKKQSERHGHMYVDKEVLIDNLSSFLDIEGVVEKQRISDWERL
ncbi:hypothetical protein JQK62_20085, partial [Leptospira santarosai]|nr:hypothetical protein [Leptospira santarosai]